MGMTDKLTTTVCPAANANNTDPSSFWDHGPHFDAHRVGWAISGACALVSSVVSVYLIAKHCRYYHKPTHQRYIIRIILLIPIYSIISWLSYRFFRYSVYYETIRDFYEAFVIAAFFALLTQYVGDAPEETKEILRNKRDMKYPFPFGCITYEPTSSSHLLFVKWGVLQYVIINPLITLASLVTEAIGVYCTESLSFGFARVYLSIIKFFSVTIAMYALITFYLTIHDEIKEREPFYKFVCVKLVIFLTFWQNIFLSILADAGVIKASQYWTSSNISTGLNALIICCEMVLFSFLHIVAFDYRGYRDFGKRRHLTFRDGLRAGLMSAFNYVDIFREIAFISKYVLNFIRRHELPDSTSKALNIYGAIHADDPSSYRPLKEHESHYEDTMSMHEQVELRIEENVEENEGLMKNKKEEEKKEEKRGS